MTDGRPPSTSEVDHFACEPTGSHAFDNNVANVACDEEYVMPSTKQHRRPPRWHLVLAGVLIAPCDASSPSAPWQAFAVAVVHTSGPLPDPDGYLIGADASAPIALADQDSVIVALANGGQHDIVLSGLAENCSPLEEISILHVAPADHDTARVTFDVDCHDPAIPGVIRVRIVGGIGRIPVGPYDVYLDGHLTNRAPLPALFTVPPGWHHVHLEPGNAIAADCSLQGGNDQDVEVPSADTVWASFSIDYCD